MAQPSQIRMNNNRKRRSDQFLLPTAKKRRKNQTNKNHNCNPKITTSPSPSIELQVLEANKSVLCPLTHLKFQHPVKSIRCNHTFERCAIHEYISTKAEEMPNQNVECPMFGCCHSIAITDLERDEQMVASMTNVNPNTNDTSNVLDWTHLSDGEGDGVPTDNNNDGQCRWRIWTVPCLLQDDDDDEFNDFNLTHDDIDPYIDDLSYQRAHDFIGSFDDCTRNEDCIFGSLLWDECYDVSITRNDDGGFDPYCSCSRYQFWCEHATALAFTFIDEPEEFELE
eukprot:889325_1